MTVEDRDNLFSSIVKRILLLVVPNWLKLKCLWYSKTRFNLPRYLIPVQIIHQCDKPIICVMLNDNCQNTVSLLGKQYKTDTYYSVTQSN